MEEEIHFMRATQCTSGWSHPCYSLSVPQRRTPRLQVNSCICHCEPSTLISSNQCGPVGMEEGCQQAADARSHMPWDDPRPTSNRPCQLYNESQPRCPCRFPRTHPRPCKSRRSHAAGTGCGHRRETGRLGRQTRQESSCTGNRHATACNHPSRHLPRSVATQTTQSPHTRTIFHCKGCRACSVLGAGC